VGALGAVTVKSFALVAVVCPATSTVIFPVVAPLGTVAVIEVAEEAVTVAVVPLNLTVGDEKFDPLIVTLDPTAPELGLKLLIVGPVPPPPAALTVPVTTKSSPAVARLFRYQVPVPVEPVTVTLKVIVVVAGTFCKAVIPERVMAL